MNPRVIAFVAVGCMGFVVQITVLAVLTFGTHWSTATATALAVEAAVLTNFFWHERWTWRDRSARGCRGRASWPALPAVAATR